MIHCMSCHKPHLTVFYVKISLSGIIHGFIPIDLTSQNQCSSGLAAESTTLYQPINQEK